MPRKKMKQKAEYYVISKEFLDCSGPYTETQARKELERWAKDSPDDTIYMAKIIAKATCKATVTVTG